MGAAGHYLALIHDRNFVRMQNGGKPMRNNHRGALVHQLLQRFLYQLFTLRIQCTGCLIQQ